MPDWVRTALTPSADFEAIKARRVAEEIWATQD